MSCLIKKRILGVSFALLSFSPSVLSKTGSSRWGKLVEKSKLSTLTVAQYSDSQEFDDFSGEDESFANEFTAEDDALLDGDSQSSSEEDFSEDNEVSLDSDDGEDFAVEEDNSPTVEESFEFEEAPAPRKKKRRARRPRRTKRSTGSLREAMSLLKSGEVEQASEYLYQLSKSSSSDQSRARYLLGLALMKMNFHQAAAFQFIKIVKSGKGRFVNLSLQKLSVVAGVLRDSSLVDYALSRMQEKNFRGKLRNVLFYRYGEYLLRSQKYVQAAKSFARVRPSSSYYLKSKYKEGYAWASAKQERKALRAFSTILKDKEGASSTDPAVVSAKLAFARVFYQTKNWRRAIDAYRNIPRNSIYWHDALFEQSWAYLLSSQFRSVLGNFHSLHSPYYEKFYQPESIVLRAIVYLYICNYDEMEKVVQLFEKVYTPVQDRLKDYLKSTKRKADFYSDFNDFVGYWRASKKSGKSVKKTYKGAIPYLVGQKLMKDGELRRLYGYLLQLHREKNTYKRQSTGWKTSDVGEYVEKATLKRIEKVSQKIGSRVRFLLKQTSSRLQGFVEQNSFLRFEMLSEKKKRLRRSRGKKNQTAKKTIDEKEARDFYVQNGYEYWPFNGEYWLDELGNYHFLGVRGCEQ